MWLDSFPDSIDVYASNNNFTGQGHLSFLSPRTWWLKGYARGIGTLPGLPSGPLTSTMSPLTEILLFLGAGDERALTRAS